MLKGLLQTELSMRKGRGQFPLKKANNGQVHDLTLQVASFSVSLGLKNCPNNS